MEPVSFSQTLKDHELIWRLWGILPKKSDGRWYMTASLLIHMGAWTWIICILLSLVNAKTVEDVINAIVLDTTFILTYIKVFFLRWNLKKIYAASAIMTHLELNTINNPVEQKALRAAQVQSKRLLLINYLSGFFGVSTFVVLALFNGDHLLYPSLYPFDWNASRLLFYSTFFFQAFFNYFVVFMQPSSDIYGPAMYSFLVAYIDILLNRLENLTEYSRSGKSRQNNMRDCVKYHHQVLILSKLFDEIFSIHLFLQISSSSIILCSTAFQMSEINPINSPVDFVFYVEYLLGMVYQLFIPCYCSSMVIHHSEKLTTSIYFCDWTGQTQRFKTSMMILVERAKKPIVFTAYKKLFYITLDTFVAVVRFAYSLLAFIKSFQ